MNHFTTLLIRNLLNNEHNLPEFESVLSEVFRQQLEEAVNDVLNYELEQFLGYERYRHTDKTDSRNGFKPDRTIDTKYGPITIKMPRDRLGLFASSLIPAYVRRTEGTERSVIDLFDLGLTNSEITEAVDRMFGAKVSKGTVSNITNRIITSIDSFKNRTLASEYAVIYIDATMMPLRRDTVQKEAVHIDIESRRLVRSTRELEGAAVKRRPAAARVVYGVGELVVRNGSELLKAERMRKKRKINFRNWQRPCHASCAVYVRKVAVSRRETRLNGVRRRKHVVHQPRERGDCRIRAARRAPVILRLAVAERVDDLEAAPTR